LQVVCGIPLEIELLCCNLDGCAERRLAPGRDAVHEAKKAPPIDLSNRQKRADIRAVLLARVSIDDEPELDSRIQAVE